MLEPKGFVDPLDRSMSTTWLDPEPSIPFPISLAKGKGTADDDEDLFGDEETFEEDFDDDDELDFRR